MLGNDRIVRVHNPIQTVRSSSDGFCLATVFNKRKQQGRSADNCPEEQSEFKSGSWLKTPSQSDARQIRCRLGSTEDKDTHAKQVSEHGQQRQQQQQPSKCNSSTTRSSQSRQVETRTLLVRAHESSKDVMSIIFPNSVTLLTDLG